jgi:predicted O-methyltransferase YrrM
MATHASESETCSTLFVTEGNVLDDSVESLSQRELFQSLYALGMPCEIVGWFCVPGDQETRPGPWLAKRGWTAEAGRKRNDRFLSRVRAGDAPVTLFHGASTKPHVFDDAERAAFLKIVGDSLDRRRPDVVVARAGTCVADVLAAARQRGIATAALLPDVVPRDPSPLRAADVVLTFTRFAAEYLREAFGLPCANLPPLVAQEAKRSAAAGPGALAFDGVSTMGSGAGVFVQIAEEIGRRRPDIPLQVLGRGPGIVTLAGEVNVQCIAGHELGGAWQSVRVLLAPMVAWDRLPLVALAALRHGIPVLGSDRGGQPELLGEAGTIVPLPDRLAGAIALPMREAELTPWIDTVLRLYDDPVFAAEQSERALTGSARWTPEKLVPQYARFLAGFASRRRGPCVTAAVSSNGFAGNLDRLRARHPWPERQPADAAPGQEEGWLGAGTDQVLAEVLSPATRLVVELGSWLGMSTCFIAQHAPSATVVSVDHWRGSLEHQNDDRYRNLLPHLFETFQSRCWDYRQRIVPLRASTLDGLRAVADHGLQPDVVFVDAEHSYEAVAAEVLLALQLFPHATLVGDDYDWSGVHTAVDSFARRHGLVVERVGWRGWRLLEGWQAGTIDRPPPARTRSVVLVPHLGGIEWECEQALRQLESAGVRVVRRGGCSAIDVARNEMLSDALHHEADAMMFVDSDIGFDPADAIRLLARPEPVVAGIYAKKGMRELASQFAPGVKQVLFGPDAPGPYPLRYAATGFLRIKADVLRRMIDLLQLPLCNTHWGRGVWPFFMPTIVPHGKEKLHYLGEDWAFSHRLAQIGVTPVADTSFRLWHWGRYSFGWEDAGSTVNRYRSYNYQLGGT